MAGSARSPSRGHRGFRPPIRQHLPGLGVFLLCFFATALVVWQLDRLITQRDREHFTNAVEHLEEAIERRLATYTDMLLAGAGLIDIDGRFDRTGFRAFVERLEPQTRYPGIRGVGFSLRVGSHELARVVQEQQSEHPGFHVWPPGPRPEYHTILDLVPLDRGNRAAIGYDMFTDEVRREAMARARDTGRPAASGPVELVQEIEADKQVGFLLYTPVFAGDGPPATVETRRNALIGFVYGPFRAGDLFSGILEAEQYPRAGFEIVDAEKPAIVLYRNTPGALSEFTQSRMINVGGRRWTIRFFSLAALDRSWYYWLLPVVFWTGLAISLLLGVLVGMQTAARAGLESAERVAREHAAMLEVANVRVQQLLDSERAARAEAERVSHLKDEFLATLSHELRTPLNAVLGWAHMVRRGGVAPHRVDHALETIERNAHAQSKLIDDLLDMSRVVSGRFRMEVSRVPLTDVIDEAINVVRPAAEAKGIVLRTTYETHPVVSADPVRLQQVFWNLLSNAAKFTPRGGVVSVRTRHCNGHVEVEVQDTGSGITPDFLPSVFDRFRQAETSSTREHGGLGLGLSIAQSLAQMHGGAIEAHSAGAGTGSTFTVRLPLSEEPWQPSADGDQDAVTSADRPAR